MLGSVDMPMRELTMDELMAVSGAGPLADAGRLFNDAAGIEAGLAVGAAFIPGFQGAAAVLGVASGFDWAIGSSLDLLDIMLY